jgi:hypothetical protein
VRVDVPIQPTDVLPSCMVCGLESFGVLYSPSCAVDRLELYVFRAQFFYKPGQLSSSNKNSGNHKLSPSVQK